ncbi:MAG TPA: hypothetical protein VE959_20750 [Bryobacteraceae bacterium]|nr:hypothetical protein [Bryobacteraceae bacterium]
MDLQQVIADLYEELASLNEAIAGLEKLAHKRINRIQRPPSWSGADVISAPQNLVSQNGSTNGRPHPASDSAPS